MYIMGLKAPLRRDEASPRDSKLIKLYYYYLLALFPLHPLAISLP
jgi:hypothetical protein